MSVAIDRNLNIIINTQGRAHRTGWVVVEIVKDLQSLGHAGWGMAQGSGHFQGGVHKTQSRSPVIKLPGRPGDLTAAEFCALTGWGPA